MEDRGFCFEGDPSAPNLGHRSPSRPEGEIAKEHAGTTGEVSSEALPNCEAIGLATVTATSSEVENAEGPPSEQKPKKTRRQRRVEDRLAFITRASPPLQIDFRSMDEKEKKRLSAALYDTRRMVATAANLCMRDYYRREGDLLDKFMRQHGRRPRMAVEWPFVEPDKGPTSHYQLVIHAVPGLATGIASEIASKVMDDWKTWRWKTMVEQIRSLNCYHEDGAIPLRKQDVRYLREGNRYFAAFSLHSGKHAHNKKQFKVPILVRDAKERTIVDNLISGEWKSGSTKIVEDRKRRGKWYIRVAYKQVAVKKVGGIAAAINRGINFFLACVFEDGSAPWIVDGRKIAAYLKQIQNRRKSYQYDSKASGRAGRGRKRILRPIQPLIDKGERWRITQCHTIARRCYERLVKNRVSILYMEDFTGIRRGEPERLKGGMRVWKLVQEWPYYKLGMSLRSLCEAGGIEVVSVPAGYTAQRCPRCGLIKEEHRDLRYWKLRCSNPECGFKRHLDIGTAMNVLARGQGKDVPIDKNSNDLASVEEKEIGTARKGMAKPAKKKGSGEACRRSRV